jgi:ankyrin repeat protein
MDVSPPPQDDDPIITQFKPVHGQWKLNDENINRIDPGTGQTILHKYCQHINTTPLEVYRYLIEVKGCDVNVKDKYKDTPLHQALCYFNPNDGGDITVLTYLLTQTNTNVNIKGDYGYSLLHYACERINRLPITIFELLITRGADVNVQDENKYAPLYYALRYFYPNKGGDINTLTYLLSQKGVNGDIKGKNGYTLLLVACEKINELPLEIFKVLIETLGCDVNVQNNDRDTPLHNALFYFDPNEGGDITVLHYLLSQKGIDGNIKDKFGYTLLHWACQRINRLRLDIFKVLIEKHGADVNAQDDGKNTPLHRAFEYFNPQCGGDINVLVYLINQTNINLNIKYKNGYTLLHTTCIINPSNTRYPMKTNAECDTTLCQIVELIAERCVQEVFDEKTPLEAATTM